MKFTFSQLFRRRSISALQTGAEQTAIVEAAHDVRRAEMEVARKERIATLQTSILVSLVALVASITAAQITAVSQRQVGTEQVRSAADKEKHDRRHDAYTELYESLTTHREARVKETCADRALGNAVDREQRSALDASAKEADAAWNRSAIRTDLYATAKLRTAIRDVKLGEHSTHITSVSGGSLSGANSGTVQQYAECEAMFADFDSKIATVRKVIQEDLGMDDS